MNADKLIVETQRQNRERWAGSDIPAPGEEMLRKIADHFLACEDCSNEFDLQGYQERTLQDFASNFLANTTLSDWICD